VASSATAKCSSRCAEMLKGHYLDLYLNLVEEVLKRGGSYNPEACLHNLEEALRKSTHVARARSVAFLVGFCRYFGRLVESYGVSPYYVAVTPGKGTLVHKILALASLHLFNEVNDIVNVSPSTIERAVNSAIDELAEADIYLWLTALRKYREHEANYTYVQRAILGSNIESWEKKLEAAKRDAVDMLDNLRKLLAHLKSIDYIKPERLYPLAEMQIVDYDLKVIGTPDLILESDSEDPSIVVEWKTFKDPERTGGLDNVSHIQSWIYALMEARRLGYGDGYGEEPLRELAEALNPDNPIVVPAVVTPKKYYVKHPIGKRLNQQIRKYADPCCTTLITIAGAYHLAALHLIGAFDDKPCKLPGKKLNVPSQGLVRAYSYTPSIIKDRNIRYAAALSKTYAGNPDKSAYINYPCGICKSMSGGLMPLACKLNFSGNRETGIIDEIYYLTRRTILKRHLKDLEALKAAYYAKIEYILSCSGALTVNVDGASRLRRGTRRCEISVDKGGTYRYLVPHVARFSLNPLDTDLVELQINFKKGDLEHKVFDIKNIEGLDSIVRPATLRVGKPAAVYLYRNVSRRPQATRLTQTPTTWLRVNGIEANNDKLIVVLGLPSSALRLGYMVFLKYLVKAGCTVEGNAIVCRSESLERNNYGLVALESQVDLTHYDLRIINQLRLLLATLDPNFLNEIASDLNEEERNYVINLHSYLKENEYILIKILGSMFQELVRDPEPVSSG